MQPGTTVYSTTHNAPCQIISIQSIWDVAIAVIWLVDTNTVVRVPVDTLRPLTLAHDAPHDADYISYVANASKIRETLELASNSESSLLISALESRTIPLPHQIYALNRAISHERIRYLFADEVGLGKTIEAGFVLRELKLRGLIKRVLIVTPKGLATQWVSEMATHFNESFKLVMGEDISSLQRFATTADQDDTSTAQQRPNPWLLFDQIIVTLDAVKPIEKRKGWSDEQVAEYNRMRYDDLITAQWDLIIIDEAHRLGGSTDQVARYRLGRGLADAASYVLLLTATPHQGKSDAFYRIMNLLDSGTFPDQQSVTQQRVKEYVVRTEKRKAIDHTGKALFKPRRTHLKGVQWKAQHARQKLLYEAVADYVRDGYNQAMREQRPAVGFLMLLMQRLVVSSTAAIAQTLERRLDILTSTDHKITARTTALEEQQALADELRDLDGESQLTELLQWHSHAVQSEIANVNTLLTAARQVVNEGPDAKAETLLELIYQLQITNNEPDLKLLIFTEFVPTQQMLAQFLQSRTISVVTLNGSMDMDERRAVQAQFRADTRVLISTDAGGEGLNLQFCHVVINYDLPWNPMRVEQRIGRIDRIGQTHEVNAYNFILAETVEYRVFDVLETKLGRILAEFGVDKASDVLDSNMHGGRFDDIFRDALIDPANILDAVDKAIGQLQGELTQAAPTSPLAGLDHTPEIAQYEALRTHPLPHWLMQATVGYLKTNAGTASHKRNLWQLSWPDGTQMHNVAFRQSEHQLLQDSTLLTLESTQVQTMLRTLPQWHTGRPVPRVKIAGMPGGLHGTWGLYEVGLQTGLPERRNTRIAMRRQRMLAIFRTHDGKYYLPTARYIWDTLLSTLPTVTGALDDEQSQQITHTMAQAINEPGAAIYNELRLLHERAIAKEHERLDNVYRARRDAIAKVGLAEVRRYRTTRCDLDEAAQRAELAQANHILPTIRMLLCISIDA